MGTTLERKKKKDDWLLGGKKASTSGSGFDSERSGYSWNHPSLSLFLRLPNSSPPRLVILCPKAFQVLVDIWEGGDSQSSGVCLFLVGTWFGLSPFVLKKRLNKVPIFFFFFFAYIKPSSGREPLERKGSWGFP